MTEREDQIVENAADIPFSKEWFEANIKAQTEETQKFYDLWRQSQGALMIMQGQYEFLLKREKKDGED